MNMFTPKEVKDNIGNAGVTKCSLSPARALALSILAGMFIAFAGMTANTVSFSMPHTGAVRLTAGLIFPFGLGMVILMGGELFTGNTLMLIALAEKKIRTGAMLRSWLLVYAGNFAGALFVAALGVAGGQLLPGDGALALHTIRVAIGKCTLGFWNAFLLGLLCNVLVTIGVLCSLSAKDTAGRILGAYMPVAFFVASGLEHSIANMYYVAAGLFALPRYAGKAVVAGLSTEALTWSSFLLGNLLPVTLGNLIGGVIVSTIFCVGYGDRR